jgi:predicted regulator of Ras-like GTPase activity (Roadblock/LC7/MglB family)
MSAVELDWLVADLVSRVPAIDRAVVLTRDGLLTAADGLTTEEAERLAAAAAAYLSLSSGVGREFAGGTVRQTIVEMDRAFLFVMAIADSSCLAVLADASADMGLVAYEMAVLVKRVGAHLAVGLRIADRSAATQ